MWLQRTENWQVFLHQHGGSATRVDRAGNAILGNAGQVMAESAADAWRALQPLLPPRCRLQVYLGADVARLSLIQGDDVLSEHDWQALAEARVGDDRSTVVIDARWRSGKRGALSVNTGLLNMITGSVHSIQGIAASPDAMLGAAQERHVERPAILQVRDSGGWTVAVIDKKTCLSLCSYPATATAKQVEIEGRRMATADGVSANAKYIVIATPFSDMPLQFHSFFRLDVLRRQTFKKAFAMVALTAFVCLMIVLSQAWHGLNEQATAVRFKQLRLNELASAIQLQREPKPAITGESLPSELATDWMKLFQELEALAVPSAGMQASNFALRASPYQGRLEMNVKPEALEKLYVRLQTNSDNKWRVASINKIHGNAAPGYHLVLDIQLDL